MITPELIEAVAREACKQMGLDADATAWNAQRMAVIPNWEHYKSDARKAIAFARAVKLCDTEGKG